MVKKSLFTVFAFVVMLAAIGCSRESQIASYNVSAAADQFEIYRRVVFYNGITDKYILVVEGYCSINVDRGDHQLELTVKTGPGTYLKHFLGLSDNVTYFAEQLQPSEVSKDRYRVIFKPESILPNIDLK